MAGDRSSSASMPSPRYRNISGRPLNRRVVLKAAAGLSAMAAAGGYSPTPNVPIERVSAQEVDGVRGREWVEAENATMSTMSAGDGWTTFEAEFPFWALGAGWDGKAVLWPVIEVQISEDGSDWGEVWTMAARHDDSGAQAEQERTYTDLLFAAGHQYIRYRTLDGEGNPSPVPGLVFTYIDPTDGPWEQDRASTMMRTTAANDDTDAPPSIITRAQWGANEDLRFDQYGEIWPPEYETVEHAIVHHAAVNYPTGGYNAVRSIYYYHCVTQGWGDIGYNYLIDTDGRIFEGRVGGQDVIGGHSFEYAIGSSGICIMGDYRYQQPTQASLAALAHIIAFVIRDLDPYATKQFHEIPNLPTICAHRDVNNTSCPGDFLYDDLPWLRDTVAATLDAGDLDTGNPAGIVPGDYVKVQTDDGGPLNLRSGPGLSSGVLKDIPDGTTLIIEEGPRRLGDGNWYMTTYDGTQGWVIADWLIVTPPPPAQVPPGELEFATNIRFTSTTNVRRSPGTSAGVIGQATRNTWAFVMAGPRTANGFDWYQLRIQGLGDGWVIRDNIAVDPVNENPSRYAFEVGDQVQTRRSTALRVRPGAAQTASATLPAGTRLTISVATVATTGSNWNGVSAPGYGGGWVAEGDMQKAPSGSFAPGDTIRVTEALNMRSGPSTGNGVIATLPAGTTGTVQGGPSSGSGYTWYQVRTNYGTGWVVQNWIAKTSGSTPSPGGKFAVGDSIRITETMNRRSGPGTGAGVIGEFTAGATGTVLEGPRSASGYTWWRMQTTSGTGWGAENWVAKSSGSTPSDPPPSGGRFDVDDTVRVTEALNMRSGPSTGNGIIATLPAGTTGTVLEGPRSGSGYTWWRIQTGSGTGWVAQDWLTETSGGSTPPPSSGGKFTSGQTVRVTETLNIRTGAGTGNGIVTTLPAGTTGTVLEGPRSGSGYTWWRIQTGRGTGWGAENWLTASGGSSGGGFESGDSFRVTEALNMRSGAGTGNGVIATLPAGTTGTITAGSRSANGYTWWPVRTNYGSGWVAADWIVKT